MLDVPALVPFSAALLVYFRLIDRNAPPRQFAWAGLLILATYFARTNYAVLLVAAIGLSEATGAGFHPKRLFGARNLYMATPLGAALALWLAYPPKLAATWAALVNISPNPEETFTAPGLLFYPHAFFVHSGSAWLFALYLAAFFWGTRHWGDQRLRVLVILVLLQLILGEFHHSKASRYILPAFPALFLLAGYFVASAWEAAEEFPGSRWRLLSRIGPPALLVLVLAHAAGQARRAEPFVKPHYETAAAMAHALGEVFRQGSPAILVGTWDLKLIPPIDWGLAAREQVVNAPQVGFVGQAAQVQALKAALRRRRLPETWKSAVLRVLDRANPVGRNLTRHVGGSPAAAETAIRGELARPDLGRLILLTSTDERAVLPLSVFESVLVETSWRPVSTRIFADVKIRADIYRRGSSEGQ